MSYRTLDPAKIIETLVKLEARIGERFPGAGLLQVCRELTEIARQTHARSIEIGRPRYLLRGLVIAVFAAGALLLATLAGLLFTRTTASNELFGTLQGIDSAFNIIVLMGAALFFVVSLEERLKRRRALSALHELRSIIHVIDMHQLTKDPSTDVAVSPKTASSPKRKLSAFELSRYLDYCSEMLSLTAKVAALYAQSFPDAVVTDAVSDLERITANLSQKIWQKITILHSHMSGAATPLPGDPASSQGQIKSS